MAIKLSRDELKYELSTTGQEWDRVQDEAFNVLLDQGLNTNDAVDRMKACFPIIDPVLIDWWWDD